ncbi:MAG: hypothetical protein ACRC2V_00885, partial [Xenococcaceae cyanobacterium]
TKAHGGLLGGEVSSPQPPYKSEVTSEKSWCAVQINTDRSNKLIFSASRSIPVFIYIYQRSSVFICGLFFDCIKLFISSRHFCKTLLD